MNPAILWSIIGEGLKLAVELLEHGVPTSIEKAKALLQSLTEGHAGAILPEDVAAAIADLRADLAANDLNADAALAAKFKA